MLPPDFSIDLLTGLVLAGGAGRRVGGADKGLIDYQGQPLAAHAVNRLHPQVGTLFISANRNLERYRQLGYPVLEDLLPDHPGPLAGLHAGLSVCVSEWLLAVPCDSPHFPENLARRLVSAAEAAHAPAAWAVTAEGSHPVFMLCQRGLLPALRESLERGERRVGGWLRSVGGIPVTFPDEAAFANFNTPEDLA